MISDLWITIYCRPRDINFIQGRRLRLSIKSRSRNSCKNHDFRCKTIFTGENDCVWIMNFVCHHRAKGLGFRNPWTPMVKKEIRLTLSIFWNVADKLEKCGIPVTEGDYPGRRTGQERRQSAKPWCGKVEGITVFPPMPVGWCKKDMSATCFSIAQELKPDHYLLSEDLDFIGHERSESFAVHLD